MVLAKEAAAVVVKPLEVVQLVTQLVVAVLMVAEQELRLVRFWGVVVGEVLGSRMVLL